MKTRLYKASITKFLNIRTVHAKPLTLVNDSVRSQHLYQKCWTISPDPWAPCPDYKFNLYQCIRFEIILVIFSIGLKIGPNQNINNLPE